MLRIIRLALLVITLTSTLVLLWPRPGMVQARRLAACQNSLTVTSTSDSGAGSLRQALVDVCSGGTVSFAAGLHDQTITLTTAELSITKTVTITNPNAANLKVSGNNAHRVFNIQPGAVVTISRLSVINGAVTDSIGGGIYIWNTAKIKLDNMALSNNTAHSGGAIYNEGELVVVNGNINNNNAQPPSGSLYAAAGGILNTDSGSLTIIDGVFMNNKATTYGGGIYNYGVVIVTSSTFGGNSAYYGGGIYNCCSSGGIVTGTVTVNNSTLSGNMAGGYGGGIFSIDGILTINQSTVSNNVASFEGGGIAIFHGMVHVRNNIIANSQGLSDCYNQNGVIAINLKNLIEDGSCGAAFKGDPRLGLLSKNGGSTPTHALLPDSPAIDAADTSTCTSASVNNLDQRGVTRPVDGNNDGIAVCDIGAFELAVLPVVQFSQAIYQENETAGTSQSIILSRTGNLNMIAQAQVNISRGTATGGIDYDDTGFPLMVTFGSGVTSQVIPIPIIDDLLEEQVESVNLIVVGSGLTITGLGDRTRLLIVDNESPQPWVTYLPVVIK